MLDFTDRESIRKFIRENDIKDMLQLNTLIKQMTGTIIEEMLEVEREAYLGYPRNKRKPDKHKEDGNSRNGYTPKTVRSSHGDINLAIPRDRNGDFQPEIVKKHGNDISEIEDKIISMYSRGMSVRDIQSHLEDIYGATISPQTISNMTDKIFPLVEEWRNRSLKEVYSIVYIDGQRFRVRSEGTVREKTVYTVLAIDLEGHKDILGLWIAETESAKYWLSVLTEIRNRGVKDILIITSDGLSGIEEAIKSVYPEAEYQGCVVHVIRNSIKYVSHKDVKEFANDLKPVYKAPTVESAMSSLEELRLKWGEKYPLAVDVWERNWDRISTMFRFTEEIRKLIYTTNPVESVHSQFRKVTRGKGHFPDDTSVMKILYLASQKMMKRWTVRIPNWNRILAQLAIHFGDRVGKYL